MRRLQVVLILLFAALTLSAPALGENSRIKVSVGEFKTLTTQDDVTRVAVANPDITDYIIISKREILLNGKKIGGTSLNVWMAGAQESIQVEVIDHRAEKLSGIIDNPRVEIMFEGEDIILNGAVRTSNERGKAGDAAKAFLGGRGSVKNLIQIDGFASLQQKMSEITENLDVKVTYTDRGVILSGKAKSPAEKADIERVIRAYLPDPNQDVTNVIEVWRKPRQVRMKVRVMEITETLNKSLGIDWGGFTLTAATVQTSNATFHNQYVASGSFTQGVGPRFIPNLRRGQAFTKLDPIMARVNALIEEGTIKILAEPEVISLVGGVSEVLIGGEVPIPVSGANNAVTIEWKEYGVKMKLEPEVDDEERISSNVFTEVSTLDFSNGVTLGGFTVPAIKTTRALSKIHCKSGRTIFLSGLKREIDQKSKRRTPFLSDIPTLGEAFVTRTRDREIVDLIISITPVLVEEEEVIDLGR